MIRFVAVKVRVGISAVLTNGLSFHGKRNCKKKDEQVILQHKSVKVVNTAS